MNESDDTGRNRPWRKRDRSLHVRISKSEQDLIRKNAQEAGRSIADYVIWRCVYMDDAKPMPPAREWRDLKGELARHGSNLNQLARAANALVKIDYPSVTLEAEVVQAAASVRIMAMRVQRELESAYRAAADSFAAGSPARH